jgi:hypothetical protein
MISGTLNWVCRVQLNDSTRKAGNECESKTIRKANPSCYPFFDTLVDDIPGLAGMNGLDPGKPRLPEFIGSP